jgi:predicted outer membrane protein
MPVVCQYAGRRIRKARSREAASLLGLAALWLLPAVALAQPEPSVPERPRPPPPASPAQLLSFVASAVNVEYELGGMARSRGGTAEVRRYGQLLAGDARAEAEQLQDVASSHAIRLKEPDALPLGLRARLSSLEGPAFDQAFLQIERNIDARTLAVLVQAAPAGAVRRLQPLFDQHLRLAVSLQRKAK